MNLDLIEIKTIKTKNKFRKIVTYKDKNNELYVIHKHILSVLEEHLYPSKFAKAYIKNRSIISNAKAHMYNDYFLFMDVKNFFNSIRIPLLKKAVFNEINKNHEVSYLEVSEIIDLCTISNRGIPLGLIPSPMLSNIYMKKTDNIIYGKLKKLNVENIIYTRYADDIIISFKLNDTNDDSYTIRKKINNIIIDELQRIGLQQNSKKNKFVNINKSNYVRITGINVIKDIDNYRKITVSRSIKKKFFYKLVNLCKNHNELSYSQFEKILNEIKGMESFIFSVENKPIDDFLSQKMKFELYEFNCTNVHDLILYLEKELSEKI